MNNEVKTINGYDIKDAKAVRTYDTLALLKADRKLKQGQHVKTRGYYSSGDGGSAEYYITDTQNNSGYQENLENGLYATLLYDDVINVKQFGAKGDNSTDNSTILKNIFENIVENGQTIYFPEGQYVYSGQITCNKFVKIKGQAWRPHNYNFCVIKNNGNAGILLTVRSSCVENIDFIGNNTYSTAYGLRFTGGRPSIINSTFSHFEQGKGLIIGGNDSNYYTDEFQIHNVLVSYCDVGIEMGSQLHPNTQLADNNAGLVSNLTVGQCRIGIYIRNSFSNNFLSLIIDTCSECGIYMENSRHNFFLNPYLECTKNINFDSTSKHNKIFGNRGFGYLTQYDGNVEENMIMGNAQDKGIWDLFNNLKSEKLLIGKRENNGYFDFTHSGHTLNISHSQSGGIIDLSNSTNKQIVKVDSLQINPNSNTRINNVKSLIGPMSETVINANSMWTYTRNDTDIGLDYNDSYNFWHGIVTFYPSLPTSVLASVECKAGKITIKLYNTSDSAVTISEGTYTVVLFKNI